MKNLQEFASANTKTNRKMEDEAKRLQTVNQNLAKTTMDDVVKLQEKTVKAMQKTIDEAPKKLIENKKEVQKLIKNLDDQEFQWKIAGMNKVQQISEITSRTSQGFDKTRHDAVMAHTKDELDRMDSTDDLHDDDYFALISSAIDYTKDILMKRCEYATTDVVDQYNEYLSKSEARTFDAYTKGMSADDFLQMIKEEIKELQDKAEELTKELEKNGYTVSGE
jgi:predicted RNase H-like nuclease (RuvC/YqgF family)